METPMNETGNGAEQAQPSKHPFHYDTHHRYFVRGEIVLVIRHEPGQPSDLRKFIEENVNSQLNSLSTEILLNHIEGKINKSINGESTGDRKARVAKLKQLQAKMDEAHTLLKSQEGLIKLAFEANDNTNELVNGIIKQFDGNSVSFIVVRPADRDNPLYDDFNLAYWTAEMNWAHGQAEGNGPGILAITPSWYLVPTMSDITSGGPGSLPIPIANRDIDLSALRDPSKPDDNGVDVFILDSIPSIAQLHYALKKYPHNCLLQQMLKDLKQPAQPGPYVADDGALTLDYYSFADRHDTHFFVPSLQSLQDHPYNMADHGLFIAGIIKERASQKNIRTHLIEILNNHGFGTIHSLLAGIEKLKKRLKCAHNPIVNCSFMFSLPPLLPKPFTALGGATDLVALLYAFLSEYPELEVGEGEQGNGEQGNGEQGNGEQGNGEQGDGEAIAGKDHFADFVSIIKDLIPEAVILASVGNDTVRGEKEFAPRYPSKLPGVIGVAAMDHNDEPAIYSNVPDTADNYLYAFGGDINHREASRRHGIPGVYTAPFMPDHSTNQSGYACWSGTSFATAVASAWLANEVVSTGKSPATRIAAISQGANKVSAKPGVSVSKIPAK